MPDVKWLREAELKHGRGAMLAFVGTCVALNGITFPGELGGYTYEPGAWYDGLGSAMSTNPFGMAQLLISIGLVEVSVLDRIDTFVAGPLVDAPCYSPGSVVLWKLLDGWRRPRTWRPRLLPIWKKIWRKARRT
jgi:hypothetical protein